MSQKTRVLKMLEDAGARGVTGNEFYRAMMPRFSARIMELKDAGHDIRTIRVDSNHFRYELKASRADGKGLGVGPAGGVTVREPDAAGVASGTDRLFTVPARGGHYNDSDAA